MKIDIYLVSFYMKIFGNILIFGKQFFKSVRPTDRQINLAIQKSNLRCSTTAYIKDIPSNPRLHDTCANKVYNG